MSTCKFSFENNPYEVYYAGQTVSGIAELITTRPKTIRSIVISVSGYAEVRWTETVAKQNSEGKRENAIETFSATETYYNSENCVYGMSGGSQVELLAGKYVFPFQVTIPPNAPTAFNGAWGRIQHEVTLVIDRVMRYNNVFKQPFTVISPYDLNLNSDNARALQKIEEKTICWGLCCKGNGPMVMKVSVPFSAYAPGQKIRFNIVLDNQLDLTCSDVKVRLMKRVTYTSRSPDTKNQVTEVKVTDNHCGEVVKLNKAEFNEFLQIPSTTPTSLSGCDIIKVEYTLKFIAKVSRVFGDLVIEFPIIIGTVPLYASTVNDQGPIVEQPGASNIYKTLSSPMFEEDIRSEEFESNKFKPRYPVYLSDANAATIGDTPHKMPPAAVNVYPSPMQANSNIYPSPIIAPSIPNAPPALGPAPTAVSAPVYVPTTPPSTTVAASMGASSNTQNTPNHTSASNEHFEVLGFSIPPDYQPTPGWK